MTLRERQNLQPWELEAVERGEAMMETLSDFFNKMDSRGHQAFAEHFKMQHRTLQQNVFRAFFKVMVETAERGQKHADHRNAESVEACEIMVKAYEKEKGFKPLYFSNI